LEIGIRLERAGGADRGHAAREVEARDADVDFVVAGERACDVSAFAVGRGIEHVVVHADEPGEDGAAGKIDRLCAGRDLHRAVRADGADFGIGDDDGLVLHGGLCGSITRTLRSTTMGEETVMKDWVALDC
jgi:hypothetical protein